MVPLFCLDHRWSTYGSVPCYKIQYHVGFFNLMVLVPNGLSASSCLQVSRLIWIFQILLWYQTSSTQCTNFYLLLITISRRPDHETADNTIQKHDTNCHRQMYIQKVKGAVNRIPEPGSEHRI